MHDGDRLSMAWVRQQEEVIGLLGLVVMSLTERGVRNSGYAELEMPGGFRWKCLMGPWNSSLELQH